MTSIFWYIEGILLVLTSEPVEPKNQERSTRSSEDENPSLS